MPQRRWPVVAVMVVTFFFALGCKDAKAVEPTAVPPRYGGIYGELNASLDQADREITARLSPGAKNPTVAVDLLVANANRGPHLLDERVIKGVAVTLDRLKVLNVGAVTVAISYPLFMPETPRHEEYIRFYQKVRAEVEARGMKLIVETGVIFPDPEYSDMRVDYSGLTVEELKRVKRYMAETIIDKVRPDYLLVGSEPETITRNTKLKMTPEIFAALVRAGVTGLDKKGVKIGAGIGSWDNPAFLQAIAGIPELDYLDLHIYPVQRGFLTDRLFKAKQIAAAAGKPVNISEAWLYKSANSELTGVPGTDVQIFARDAYSFWMPLDMKFLDVTFKAARYLGSDYCSFFWMQYLYGYVDYSAATKNMSYTQLKVAVNQVASKNIVSGTPNALGWYLADLAGR